MIGNSTLSGSPLSFTLWLSWCYKCYYVCNHDLNRKERAECEEISDLSASLTQSFHVAECYASQYTLVIVTSLLDHMLTRTKGMFTLLSPVHSKGTPKASEYLPLLMYGSVEETENPSQTWTFI